MFTRAATLNSQFFFPSARRLFSSVVTPVPGLQIFRNFLDSEQTDVIQKHSLQLFKSIQQDSATRDTQSCRTFLSKYHNLDSDEYYKPVNVIDSNGHGILGQHFPEYGGKGHQLTYFTTNRNLPDYVKEQILKRILKLPGV